MRSFLNKFTIELAQKLCFNAQITVSLKHKIKKKTSLKKELMDVQTFLMDACLVHYKRHKIFG